MAQMKPEDSQAVPFFARFLEGQNVEELSDAASEAISGGKSDTTKPKKDEIAVTLKYPSDGEDFVTLKYPSDGEETTTIE